MSIAVSQVVFNEYSSKSSGIVDGADNEQKYNEKI